MTHRPTVTARRRVVRYAGVGMIEAEIAAALKITIPTLRKYYREELVSARAKLRAEMIDLMYEHAKKKNFAAIKHLEQLAAEAPPALMDLPKATQAKVLEFKKEPGAEVVKPSKPPALGKKQLANLDAQDAEKGTSWAELMNPVAPTGTEGGDGG